ncbi:unnamed protein product [Periconia digitata]|uniref:Uncharacterized protein n=1 Tax=Periconia digitata TaxID=1303443 RepID=A0A9W4U5Y8_9PLEO|nr:unnamed protein product [Periconia digitata]
MRLRHHQGRRLEHSDRGTAAAEVDTADRAEVVGIRQRCMVDTVLQVGRTIAAAGIGRMVVAGRRVAAVEGIDRRVAVVAGLRRRKNRWMTWRRGKRALILICAFFWW